MTEQATAPATPDERSAQIRLLAEVLFTGKGSDARAGLGQLVREIETSQPGFIARLNAVNDARRLGLWSDLQANQ